MGRLHGPPLALVLLLASGSARSAPCPGGPDVVEQPWAAAATVGPGFGFFYATHGRLNLQAGRRLWRRLELDVELRLGFGRDLFGVEPAARVGVFFPVSRRAQLALAARAGYGSYRVVEPGRTRWLGTAVVGIATEVRFRLPGAWELRLVPAATTLFLTPPLWGVVLEPTVGLARRF